MTKHGVSRNLMMPVDGTDGSWHRFDAGISLRVYSAILMKLEVCNYNEHSRIWCECAAMVEVYYYDD